MMISENPRRHDAMASGSACDRRTRGPDAEIPSNAEPRTNGVRRRVARPSAAGDSAGVGTVSAAGTLVTIESSYFRMATMIATVEAMIWATVPVSAM